MTTTVTLNVDLGELEGEPEELYALATQANVACGGHAGDEVSMTRAVALAARHGTRVAAHPSYPDRAGFGRKTMPIETAALASAIEAQCRALAAIARAHGIAITIVKPHGALYHDVDRDPARAEAFLDGAIAALGPEIAIVGYPGSSIVERARARGGSFLAEGFADRGYDAHGRLLPRGTAGAMLDDPRAAAAQALRLARSGEVATICVHGDTHGAIAIARAVREALAADGLLA